MLHSKPPVDILCFLTFKLVFDTVRISLCHYLLENSNPDLLVGLNFQWFSF